MSLEQAIMQQTEVLSKIYVLLASLPNAAVTPVLGLEQKPAEQKPAEQKPAEQKPAVKTATPKKSTPAPTTTPEPVKPIATKAEVPAQVPAEPKAQQVSSLEEAINATVRLGRVNYSAAKAILLKYSATNAREVPEDQLLAYIQDIKNALSE